MLFLPGLSLSCVFGIIAVHNNPAISPNFHALLIIPNSVTSIGSARKLPALLSERPQVRRFTVLR